MRKGGLRVIHNQVPYENIDIAIIDDGIHPGLYDTGQLKFNLEITPQLSVDQCSTKLSSNNKKKGDSSTFVEAQLQAKKRWCSTESSNNTPYLSSHGTICAAIIKKYAPRAILGSIKVLNDKTRGQRAQLEKAVEWCILNNIKIIHLSIGTIDYRDFSSLKKLINTAYRKGIIIVASCNNKNVFTYPASLSNVIGVKTDWAEKLGQGEYLFHFFPPDGIDITASARHTLVDINGKQSITPVANSYASPMITALIYRMLVKNPGLGFNEIKEGLLHHAINKEPVHYPVNFYNRIDWIETAAAVVLSKNNIIFNSRNSMCISKTYNTAAPGEVKQLLSEDNNFLDSIDTIIILKNDNSIMFTKAEFSVFFKEMLQFHKNIVYIDDNCPEIDINAFKYYKDQKIFFSSISGRFVAEETGTIIMDMPLITVYDFPGDMLVPLLSELASLFKEDGYYPVVSSDISKCVLADMEYTPLFAPPGPGTCLFIDRLKTLSRVYYADVHLLGIRGTGKPGSFFKNLGDAFEIDLHIILLNKDISCADMRINKIIDCRDDNPVILFLPAGSRGFSIYRNMRNVYIVHSIEELYKKIIFLFENKPDDTR